MDISVTVRLEAIENVWLPREDGAAGSEKKGWSAVFSGPTLSENTRVLLPSIDAAGELRVGQTYEVVIRAK